MKELFSLVFILLCFMSIYPVSSWRNFALSFKPNPTFQDSARNVAVASTMVLSDDILKNTPKGKVRVRLHQNVSNCGAEGEIRFVSFQMYTNVLAPQKLAAKVRDSDIVALVNSRNSRLEKEQKDLAILFDALKSYGTLSIEKSIGPNGQLFGAVTKKNVIEMLADALPLHSSIINDPKSLQVDTFEAINNDGRKTLLADIRRAGNFTATISLPPYKQVINSIDFPIQVIANTPQ